MSVCPWCKATNPGAADTCLECGKRAADHPSIAGRDVGTLGDFSSGGSEPPAALDIELGASLPHRGGSGDASVQGGALQSFGDDWGDDEAEKGGALDLVDLPGPPSGRSATGRGAAVASSTSTPAMRAVETASAPPSKRQASQKMQAVAPTERRSVPEDRPAVDIDRYEILALADYGTEPKGMVQTIPYAIRVHRRRRELRRALEAVRKALADAEARRDDRLVELGELLRPHIGTSSELQRFTGMLENAEKTRNLRSAGMAEADAAFKDRVSGIDRDVAALDAPIAAAKADVEAKTKAAAEAETLRQKHEARRKRVEIDVRAAQAVLARPDATPDQKRQAQSVIATATGEKDVRATEEKIATTAAQEAEARAAAARRALEDLEGKLAALRSRRRDAERDFSRQAQIRGEGIEAASKEVRDALLEIGRATATAAIAIDGADVRRKSIAESQANVKRLQLDLEKHLRALDAANPDAVKKGTILLVAIVVLLVGAFVAWRALRSNPYLDEHKSAPTAPAK